MVLAALTFLSALCLVKNGVIAQTISSDVCDGHGSCRVERTELVENHVQTEQDEANVLRTDLLQMAGRELWKELPAATLMPYAVGWAGSPSRYTVAECGQMGEASCDRSGWDQMFTFYAYDKPVPGTKPYTVGWARSPSRYTVAECSQMGEASCDRSGWEQMFTFYAYDTLIKTATTPVSNSDDDFFLGDKSPVNTVPAGYTDGGDGLCQDEETRQEFNALYAKGKTLQECADAADSDPNSIAFDFAPASSIDLDGSECDIRYPSGTDPIYIEGFEWWNPSRAGGSGSPVGMGLNKNGRPSHCYVKKVASHVPAGYTDGGDGFCEDEETRQEFNAIYAKGKTLQECADVADSDPNSIAFDFAPGVFSKWETNQARHSECDIRYPCGVGPIMEGFEWWKPSMGAGSGSPVGMGLNKNGRPSHCYVKKDAPLT